VATSSVPSGVSTRSYAASSSPESAAASRNRWSRSGETAFVVAPSFVICGCLPRQPGARPWRSSRALLRSPNSRGRSRSGGPPRPARSAAARRQGARAGQRPGARRAPRAPATPRRRADGGARRSRSGRRSCMPTHAGARRGAASGTRGARGETSPERHPRLGHGPGGGQGIRRFRRAAPRRSARTAAGSRRHLETREGV
jgi:hypothetical protein